MQFEGNKNIRILVSFAKEDHGEIGENTIQVLKSNQTSTRCSYIGAEGYV